ncbi:ABC transporter I family member 19-like isoform X2 [Populus alba x Populus x berolinensis]|uniref:Uncharacterized protein n=2 Tax=Populus alba TaxID=43335 RepID=A0ACC4CDI0_POPAL|nr:ABC transporter I family member 19-like isoform X2 [Populus alba]KAJ6931356.1 ABC transporter I family member 19-like isoform X2 [Populus alba x Populus x berolinensis]TKS03382.1 ABC transporter I family member 19-like [Populus alba]
MAEKASQSEEGGGRGRGENEKANSISIRGMQFAYPGQHPLFYEFNLNISPGSRCLLVGSNGSGKHMAGGRDVVRVINGSAFHDTQLVCRGDLAYLGGSWSKTVGSAVSSVSF